MYGTISMPISGTLNQSVFLLLLKSLLFVYDPVWEKLLTCLRLNFSHLKEHQFRNGFADTINPMCAYRADTETTEHFLLHCQFYSTQRLELFHNLETANSEFKNLSGKDQVSFMLYGSKNKYFWKF